MTSELGDRSARLRAFFAHDVAARGGGGPRIAEAFDEECAGQFRAIGRLISRIEVGEGEMSISLQGGAAIIADVVGRVRQTKPRGARRKLQPLSTGQGALR